MTIVSLDAMLALAHRKTDGDYARTIIHDDYPSVTDGEDRATSMVVDQALSALPYNERRCVEMVVLAGMSYRECANHKTIKNAGHRTWTASVYVYSKPTFAARVGEGRAKGRIVLAELGLVEQGLAAVKEVVDDGATVTDVARRYPAPGDATRDEPARLIKNTGVSCGSGDEFSAPPRSRLCGMLRRPINKEQR